jgi:hypothetical protein
VSFQARHNRTIKRKVKELSFVTEEVVVTGRIGLVDNDCKSDNDLDV